MENNDCIFCKIVKGEIPANKIYEDKDVIAFLDINPVTIGHTLVIPKKHYINTFDIPIDLLCKINKVAKELGTKFLKALDCDGANFINASGEEAEQSVFHYHMHIVPRYKSDGLKFWPEKKNQAPTQNELKSIEDKITKKLT